MTVHTGNIEQQMQTMVDAVRELTQQIETHHRLAQEEPEQRVAHLKVVAAASSSLLNAAWSLMGMAMDQANGKKK